MPGARFSSSAATIPCVPIISNVSKQGMAYWACCAFLSSFKIDTSGILETSVLSFVGVCLVAKMLSGEVVFELDGMLLQEG